MAGTEVHFTYCLHPSQKRLGHTDSKSVQTRGKVQRLGDLGGASGKVVGGILAPHQQKLTAVEPQAGKRPHGIQDEGNSDKYVCKPAPSAG